MDHVDQHNTVQRHCMMILSNWAVISMSQLTFAAWTEESADAVGAAAAAAAAAGTEVFEPSPLSLGVSWGVMDPCLTIPFWLLLCKHSLESGFTKAVKLQGLLQHHGQRAVMLTCMH